MQKILLTAAILLAAATAGGSELTFTGNSSKVISIKPEASTGIECLYMLRDNAGVTISYRAASASATVNWYRYSNLGGAYAESIEPQRDGTVTSIAAPAADYGYIIEEGTSRHYFWVANYANHPLSLTTLSVSPDGDCSAAYLEAAGQGAPIIYYTINGLPKELGRDLVLTYSTLSYDDASESFRQKTVEKHFDDLASRLRVDQPLCDTEFKLTGDRFLQEWGQPQSATSQWYQATAVDGHTTAVQTERDNDNESTDATTALGGSAPVEITFTAQVTDAVRFTEWQFSQDPEFNTIDLRFNTLETTYIFRDYGTTYVRFQASNNDGSCDWFSERYDVEVGQSSLQCPNAFSPGNRDGVNDEWKVSYRSIIEFECHIFNRWGEKMAELTDPSQGWDGRYRGKLVPSGAYYYVIKARGADGKDYKLAGDINIINRSQNFSQPSED